MLQVPKKLQPEIGIRRRPLFRRSITIDRDGPNVPQEGRQIPWPEVPCWPVLSDLGALGRGGRENLRSRDQGLFAIGDPRFVPAGRIAIGSALRLLGLNPGEKVLLPAHHCLSMIEPLAWFGLDPVFYKINEDLSIDLEDVAAKLDEHCKALTMVHYFGFPQPAAEIRDFCDNHGLALIEDCAHSFFGTYDGAPLGSFGDVAIGSLTKFFAVYEGGCLVSARRDLPHLDLEDQGRVAELRAWVTQLQVAHYYGRLRALAPLTAIGAGAGKIMSLVSSHDKQAINPAQQRSGAGGGTDARWLKIAANKASLAIARATEPADLITRRRANYRRICDALNARPGISVLKPRVDDGVVPYMVPIWIDDLRRVFPVMEDRAIPMQRFGQFLHRGVDESICPTSAALSHHGIQLPCHQDLKDGEIDWVVEQVVDCVAGLSPSPGSRIA